jgi:hypothetical protein
MKNYTVNGNILFLILIAVALFAALSYAVTTSSRSGESTISKDKARLFASETIQYATSLQNAVNKMKLINGCKDSQISFNSTAESYPEGHAPSDKSCHIFDPNGGGQYFKIFDKAMIEQKSNFKASDSYRKPFFAGRYAVSGIGITCNAGADCTDLIMVIPFVEPDIALAINKLAGIGEPFNDQVCSLNYYNSQKYSGLQSIIQNCAVYGDTNPDIVGKNFGCVHRGDLTGANLVNKECYFVLSAR